MQRACKRTADRMTWSHCAVALTRSFCFALFRAHQCSILITDRAQIMAAGPMACFLSKQWLLLSDRTTILKYVAVLYTAPVLCS